MYLVRYIQALKENFAFQTFISCSNRNHKHFNNGLDIFFLFQSVNGHKFVLQSFDVPRYCSMCNGLLWGVGYQGYACLSKLHFVILTENFLFAY